MPTSPPPSDDHPAAVAAAPTLAATPAIPAYRPLPTPLRWVVWVLGVVCLGLAFLGALLPGLPATPFALLAAWAAGRSSPRLHSWLWQHPWAGPMLRDWAAGGYVSRKAKKMASACIALSCALLWLLPSASVPNWARGSATLCMTLVLLWLWLRPEPPKRPAC